MVLIKKAALVRRPFLFGGSVAPVDAGFDLDLAGAVAGDDVAFVVGGFGFIDADDEAGVLNGIGEAGVDHDACDARVGGGAEVAAAVEVVVYNADKAGQEGE